MIFYNLKVLRVFLIFDRYKHNNRHICRISKLKKDKHEIDWDNWKVSSAIELLHLSFHYADKAIFFAEVL